MDYAATEPLESYYNGLNTLREKTYIAMKNAGGVMLFDINEDTNDETSVVSMIHGLLGRTAELSREELKRNVSVVLNNRELVFLKEEGLGVPYINTDNRTMIPLRKPLEAIGAMVSFDENNRVVTAVKNNITVQVTIGEKAIYVNGQKLIIDTEAVLKDGRTYIPLRAVFSAFGYDMAWHGSSNTVNITEIN